MQRRALTRFLGYQSRTFTVSYCMHILICSLLSSSFLTFSPSAPLHHRCTAIPVSRLLGEICVNVSRITVCQHTLFNKQCKELCFSKAFALLFLFFLFLILSFLIRQQKGQFGEYQADTSTWESTLLLLWWPQRDSHNGSDSSRTSGPLFCECKGYQLSHTVGIIAFGFVLF